MKNAAKLFLSVIFTVSLCISVEAKEPDWLIKLRKLKVFSSTKTDVEKVFDIPKVTEIYNYAEREKDGWSMRVDYETDEGELEAEYSIGKCSENRSTIGYDVDKDVVVDLTFRPNIPFFQTDLEYDLKTFEAERVTDIENAYIFSNYELGTELYIVDKKVEKIDFVKTEKHKALKCKNKE